jgi:hypothetical protein
VTASPVPADGESRPEVPPSEGWKKLYTRSFELRAPAEFARHWFLDQGIGPNAVPLSPRVRQSIDRKGSDAATVRLDFEDGSSRTDSWQFADPQEVTVTKRLEEHGRTQLWSRERYRFSRVGTGSSLEISSERCPVTFRARMALRISVRTPMRPESDERAMCDELDRAYSGSVASPVRVR